MKYRLRQVLGFAADVPAPTESRENLSLQQSVSQNGILSCIYAVRSQGFCSFSSVKQSRIDTRENRSIFEAIFQGVPSTKTMENKSRRETCCCISLLRLLISALQFQYHLSELVVSQFLKTGEESLGSRLGIHHYLFFPYVSLVVQICCPDPARKVCFLMRCIQLQMEIQFGLFSSSFLIHLQLFFSVLLASRLAGSLLYSYHVKYLAEYKELIMGIYSEGIIAV